MATAPMKNIKPTPSYEPKGLKVPVVKTAKVGSETRAGITFRTTSGTQHLNKFSFSGR
jgi:hypothetical protein